MLSRLVPGLLMVAFLAAATFVYPSARHYFAAVQAFSAAERGDPETAATRIEAAIELASEELGVRLDASREELAKMITGAHVISQAERAHIFNTVVAGIETVRTETQKLRGEVAALNEQLRPQKAPKAQEPQKPARKPPQAPQAPSGLFSLFPTSWEPTISWEATVVDHRPRGR